MYVNTFIYFPGMDASSKSVMDKCKEILPSYMIPKMMPLKEIPLQPFAGKVDRVKLREIYESLSHEPSAEAPAEVSDDLALKILKVISSQVNIPVASLSLQDNFFEVGGNSTNAISTIFKLKEEGLSISIPDFLKALNIQELVEIVQSENLDVKADREKKYKVTKLKDDPEAEELVYLLAKGFAEKTPLTC